MEEHSLQVLEYDKVRALLGRFPTTDLGRERVEALGPGSELESVRAQLRLTTEARRSVDQLLEPALTPVHDLRPLLDKLAPTGAYLDSRELLQVKETLATTRKTAEFTAQLPSALPNLKALGAELEPQPEIEQEIGKILDDEGRVKHSASRQLKAIRRSIRETQDWITRRLERMLRKTNIREHLQEPYFTQREGRYVLPVITNHKGKIPGLVHDCSDTGTTTFIEPLEIVERGNRLRELQAEAEVEIRKILRQVSASIHRADAALRKNIDYLGQIDFAYAKGRFSSRFGMQEPEVARGGVLKIRQARHPLLLDTLGTAGEVVPLDFQLGDTFDGLLITGPNTGGKTVVLKCAGLLCLMAASGLHIPAGDGTRIVLYDKVFADIGDEQSLEQSLSTFSSHITRISKFLTECDENTLVLLDELGTGTDPVEGGALGVAILDTLRKRGARWLVTTHLNQLKVYAYGTEQVENGAMSFDHESLEPNYRLEIGTPGSSYALDIATRLGLPAEVTEHARAQIEQDEQNTENLLERLSNDTRRATEARHTAQAEQEKAENLRLELARRLDSVEREREGITERARREARDKLDHLQATIRTAEEELEQLLERAEGAATAEIERSQETLGELKQQQLNLRMEAKRRFKAPAAKAQYVAVEPERLEPGQSIHLHGFSYPGEILSLDSKKKEAEVQVQSLTFHVPWKRILGIVKPEERPRPARSAVTVETDTPEEFPHSLDIHGLTQEEAWPKVEKYIDAAALAGWGQVYIIHGRGTGVLRDMVRRLLNEHPLVKRFRRGDYFEGGDGITVAML